MKKLIVFALALVLTGCASMMHGNTQTIRLKTSDNKRVKVQLKNNDGVSVYTLPTTIHVKKSKTDIVVTTVATECINATTSVIPSHVDGWVFVNVANLGLGLIEDLSGPAWKYDDVFVVPVKRDQACINRAKKLNQEILNLHQ